MINENKKLPIPSLNSKEVAVLMKYVNDELPTKYGKEILGFIEKIALEAEKENQTEEIKAD
jgi:hypothetical protein